MKVDIKKNVMAFKEQNPGIKKSDIAAALFPHKDKKQAAEILSGVINGHRDKVMDTEFVIRVCKHFKITPNEFFNYE